MPKISHEKEIVALLRDITGQHLEHKTDAKGIHVEFPNTPEMARHLKTIGINNYNPKDNTPGKPITYIFADDKTTAHVLKEILEDQSLHQYKKVKLDKSYQNREKARQHSTHGRAI